MTIASRRERIYSQWPDPVTGYELNPDHCPFSVVIPEATTNLVTNPSVEGQVLTGYTAVGGTRAATFDWQAFGACGLELTPAVSTESGFYFGTVTLAAGMTYTASVVIQGEAGKIYYIYFASTAGALLSSKQPWIGTGHKQRIWVTYPEATGASRRVYVTRDARYPDQNKFYADGLQVEAKAYPTTYCDGDQVGFIKTQVDYIWNGTPGASTSTRSANTRAGGREVNLLDLGFHVLAIIGLGMATMVDQSLVIPGRGEFPQGTGTQAREFSLVGAIDFDSPRHGQALRSALINDVKPDATILDQPMILRYQACDDEGYPTGDSLDIVCKYRSGLEGNIDNNHQERLALNFKMYLPFMKSTYTGGVELGYQTTVANANYILMQNGATGLWQAMATGTNGDVLAILPDFSGNVYIAGDFTNLTDANGDYISMWNGTAFSSLGTGMNAEVRALAIGPDGSIYAGGSFTTAGGGAANRIAKWDGANWTALGGGTNGDVTSIVFGIDGYLYVGGGFTLAGGVAGTAYIARWTGAAWEPLDSGLNDVVYALAMAADGSIYAGGDFTNAGGANGDKIAKWTGAAWEALGTGTNNTVYALTVGPDQSLYAGGAFSLMGMVANTAYIARWNGNSWMPLGTGVNLTVYSLTVGPDNSLYAGGRFTTAGGIALPDRMAKWNGSVWIPLDVNLSGVPWVLALKFDKAGNFYVGSTVSGSAISATVTLHNVGSTGAYPVVKFTGPGTVYQLKNYTTGKAIYFDLTLLAGESAVLCLDPTNIFFVSSFRGNILNSVLRGSHLLFILAPGDNNISAYFFGSTTAATNITATIVPLYWSLDGAVWQ